MGFVKVVIFTNVSFLIYVRIIAFDFPHEAFENKPFEERYWQLLANIPSDHKCIVSYLPLSSNLFFDNNKHIAPRTMVKGEPHLKFMLHSILEDAGEGIIARKVGSVYEHGRTSSLIKLKVDFV